MNTTQIIGIIAGVLTSGSMLPQLIKLLKEKKAKDVSLGMLLMLNAGIAMWIVYGFMKDDLPILVTNSFALFINMITFILSIRYKNK